MSTRKKAFWSLFSLLLAVLSVWAVLSQSGSASLPRMAASLHRANKWWFIAAVICAALYILLESAALRCILKSIGYRNSFLRTSLYSTADVYFSAITPSATGGQPATAYFMLKDGIPAGVTTVTLLVNLCMYTLSILVLGILVLALKADVFLAYHTLAKILIILGFVLLTGLVLLFLVLLRREDLVFGLAERFLRFLHRHRIIHALDSRLEKLNKAKEDYRACARTMQGKNGTLLRAMLWNIGQRASQMAVPVCLYLALGGKTGMAGTIFSTQCLSTLGYSYVPIPGSIGIADILMLDGFTDLLGAENAVILEMLSRGISFYLCVIFSGICTAVGYLMLRRREKRGDTE